MPLFTPLQHQKLLKILDQTKLDDISGTANMTGNHLSSNASLKWIIDTGAFHHIVRDYTCLYNSVMVENAGQVQLPTGTSAKVSHIGDCHIGGGDVLRRVLCVPAFKFNLLSVSQMTKDLNCCVTFYPSCSVLQDLGSGKMRMIGKEEDGLYTFYPQPGQYDHNKMLQPHHCMTTIQSVEANANIWHQRLGHVPMGVIRKISSFHKFGNKFALHKCDICPLARQTRLPFPHSTSSSTCVFQLPHMDVWGPDRVETYDGMRYFFTIVDDYSRWTWTFLMRLKYDVVSLLKQFVAEIETQFDKRIKRIRSDNGTEFFNTNCDDLFKLHGIIHESSCPYTPQQNGVVERRHRHILETARAVKFQAGFPDKFWGLCIRAATHVLNRIPSTTLGNISSFEKLYGRPPLLDHMRVVGRMCFATNITTHDKFSPRAI